MRLLDRLRVGIASWSGSGAIARGLLAITTATGMGQGVNVILLPVLSRLYSPEAFGTFAFLLAAVGIVAAASGLRLESAVPLTKDVRETAVLVRLALIFATATALMLPAVLWFWLKHSGDSTSAIVFLAAPLSILTYGYIILGQCSVRDRDYTAVARRSLSFSVVTGSAQLALGLVSGSAANLMVGQTAGRAASVFGLARSNWRVLKQSVRLPDMRLILRRYWRFPCLFTPASILNDLGAYLPLLVVAQWYGTADAGNLAMAQRMLVLPAALIGTAVAQVMMGETAERLRSGKPGIAGLYVQASKKLLWIAVPLTVISFCLGPILLPLVLGDQWSLSGEFARAMALSVGIGFIASPLSGLYYVLNGAIPQLALDIARPALVALTAWTSHAAGFSSTQAVASMYATFSVIYLATWVIGYALSRRADNDLKRLL